METAITLSSSKERDQNVTIRSMKNFFVFRWKENTIYLKLKELHVHRMRLSPDR